jgi:peptide/nickel transport system substrate-binding protein
MLRHKSWKIWLGAAVVGLTAAVGVGSASAEKVFRFVPWNDMKGIDPIVSIAYPERNHGYLIYDTLFAINSKNEIKPQMVDTYTVSPDGNTHDFKLRAGLKWHDGQPVRAIDCVTSLQRWGKRDPVGRLMFDAMESLTVTSEDSFKMVFKRPFGQVLPALAKIGAPNAFMMPERVAKGDPFVALTDTTGSGPYIFVKDEWRPGNKIVYKKNPNYVPRNEPPDLLAGGKVANFDRVEFIVIPDGATAVAALSAGEVDWLERPQLDLLPLLERNKEVVVKPMDPFGYQTSIRINHLHPPFNDARVRRALMLAFDQNEFLRISTSDANRGITCRVIYLCNTRYAKDVLGDSTLLLKKDIPEAKRLLKEAGYNGEKVYFIDIVDLHPEHEQGLLAMDNLRAIGMNVEAISADVATFFALSGKKEKPGEGGWNLAQFYADSVNFSEPLTNTVLRTGGVNNAGSGWPDNPKIEALKGEFLAARTPEDQQRIADAIQKEAYDFSLTAVTGQFQLIRAFRRNVTGVPDTSVPVFWGIDKK